MNTRVLPLISSMALIIFGALANEASAQTTPVDQDSWLKEAASGDNFGSDQELPIKKKSTDNERAVIRFDLSSIPDDRTNRFRNLTAESDDAG